MLVLISDKNSGNNSQFILFFVFQQNTYWFSGHCYHCYKNSNRCKADSNYREFAGV